MSIYYRLYQNKMKNNKACGKYFARAVHTDMVDLDDISDIIERNCTLKRSDVKACLTELVEVMRDKMQSSNKVRINGLGIFKINIKSAGVTDPSEFKGNNITGYRVVFTPEHSVMKASGSYVDGKYVAKRVNNYYLLEGITAKHASQFGDVIEDTTATDDSEQSGSDTPTEGSGNKPTNA
jgi:predicted histone-like DNA-binding protein